MNRQHGLLPKKRRLSASEPDPKQATGLAENESLCEHVSGEQTSRQIARDPRLQNSLPVH
jgi:hypothetical protein